METLVLRLRGYECTLLLLADVDIGLIRIFQGVKVAIRCKIYSDGFIFIGYLPLEKKMKS